MTSKVIPLAASRRRAPGQPTTVDRIETYWWGFVLFMCSSPFPFIFQRVDPYDPFSLLQQKSLYIYFKMAVLLPVLWQAWSHREKLYAFAIQNIFLIFFVVLAFISSLWALSPYLAARSAFDLALTLLVCATMASSLKIESLIAAIGCFF